MAIFLTVKALSAVVPLCYRDHYTTAASAPPSAHLAAIERGPRRVSAVYAVVSAVCALVALGGLLMLTTASVGGAAAASVVAAVVLALAAAVEYAVVDVRARWRKLGRRLDEASLSDDGGGDGSAAMMELDRLELDESDFTAIASAPPR